MGTAPECEIRDCRIWITVLQEWKGMYSVLRRLMSRGWRIPFDFHSSPVSQPASGNIYSVSSSPLQEWHISCVAVRVEVAVDGVERCPIQHYLHPARSTSTEGS